MTEPGGVAAAVTPRREAPGPRGGETWRVFGALRDDPCAFQEMLRDRWGHAVGFRLFTDRVFVSFDPDTLAEVLLDKRGIYTKDKVTAGLSAMLGQGLLTSEGALWKRQRKLVAPSLGKRRVEGYAASMVARAEAAAVALGRAGARAADGGVDVHGAMNALTLGIVLDTLFGAELEGDAAHVGDAIDEAMSAFELLARSLYRFFPEWVPTGPRRRTDRAKRTLDAVVLRTIDARRRAGASAPGAEAAGEGEADAPADLLSVLLAAKDEAGDGMSVAQLRDELVTLFTAGHETTAGTLSFALWLLAAEPVLRGRLRAEVDAAVAEAPLGFASLPRLPLVDAVVRETLRVYPTAYLLGRSNVEDVVLGGVAVPRGTQILVPVWAMHRDPRFWDAPTRFDPDRWLDGRAAAGKVHRGVYFPFGGGPRVCVGNHFAQMEAVLALAAMLRHVDVARIPGRPEPALQAAVTLRPRDGIVLRVAPRAAQGV